MIQQCNIATVNIYTETNKIQTSSYWPNGFIRKYLSSCKWTDSSRWLNGTVISVTQEKSPNSNFGQLSTQEYYQMTVKWLVHLRYILYGTVCTYATSRMVRSTNIRQKIILCIICASDKHTTSLQPTQLHISHKQKRLSLVLVTVFSHPHGVPILKHVHRIVIQLCYI